MEMYTRQLLSKESLQMKLASMDMGWTVVQETGDTLYFAEELPILSPQQKGRL